MRAPPDVAFRRGSIVEVELILDIKALLEIQTHMDGGGGQIFEWLQKDLGEI